MGRGAPNKKGLDYFPKMVDFYEDDRIFDLLDRYGPLGVTVYDCILCIVYAHGYYAEIPLDKLSKMIVKMIGNKWVKNNKAVVQVVHFCSEIGLLNDDLMTENIITSAGIQKRYYEIAVKRLRRQPHTDKYWLLGKEENVEPLLNVPLNQISSGNKRINAEEIQNNSAKSTLKEKVKEKDIYISVAVGCAGEEELLRRYYNKEIGLDIEDIIKSVLLTRLFLLDIIDKKEVYEIVDNAIDIANNLNIDELLESFDIFLNKA